jgi:hypothetical protein
MVDLRGSVVGRFVPTERGLRIPSVVNSRVGEWMRSVRNSRAALRALWLTSLVAGLAACAPEVGSERWCQALRDKPRGDWTANEALDFARHCVL